VEIGEIRLRANNTVVSLNGLGDDDGKLSDQMAVSQPLPEEKSEQGDDMNVIVRCLAWLTPFRQVMVKMRKGIGTMRPGGYSLPAIAGYLGLTRERARQIILEALRIIPTRPDAEALTPEFVSRDNFDVELLELWGVNPKSEEFKKYLRMGREAFHRKDHLQLILKTRYGLYNSRNRGKYSLASDAGVHPSSLKEPRLWRLSPREMALHDLIYREKRTYSSWTEVALLMLERGFGDLRHPEQPMSEYALVRWWMRSLKRLAAYPDGWTEISEVLGVNVDTVKRRFSFLSLPEATALCLRYGLGGHRAESSTAINRILAGDGSPSVRQLIRGAQKRLTGEWPSAENPVYLFAEQDMPAFLRVVINQLHPKKRKNSRPRYRSLGDNTGLEPPSRSSGFVSLPLLSVMALLGTTMGAGLFGFSWAFLLIAVVASVPLLSVPGLNRTRTNKSTLDSAVADLLLEGVPNRLGLNEKYVKGTVQAWESPVFLAALQKKLRAEGIPLTEEAITERLIERFPSVFKIGRSMKDLLSDADLSPGPVVDVIHVDDVLAGRLDDVVESLNPNRKTIFLLSAMDRYPGLAAGSAATDGSDSGSAKRRSSRITTSVRATLVEEAARQKLEVLEQAGALSIYDVRSAVHPDGLWLEEVNRILQKGAPYDAIAGHLFAFTTRVRLFTSQSGAPLRFNELPADSPFVREGSIVVFITDLLQVIRALPATLLQNLLHLSRALSEAA